MKTTEEKYKLKAEDLLLQLNTETKMGDLRKLAKEIKKNHALAMELWTSEKLHPRLLAILIMDKNLLTEEVINQLTKDLKLHTYDERNQLMDWLMANQLTKSKKQIAIIESWEKSSFTLQRRIYWYYQGRLRWTGKTPPNNTEQLLLALEASIADEEPEVQWAMNFTAGWIGIYEEQYRNRCVRLGEEVGLYKNEKVAKGCTPNYLPKFIQVEVGKQKNK